MGEDMNCHEMQLTVSWATEMYAAPLYARGLKVAGKADEAMSVTKKGAFNLCTPSSQLLTYLQSA